MTAAHVRPFSDSDLDPAATLLAARHARQRSLFPALDPAFENADTARLELTALWEQDDASGGVAVRDGSLTAFVIATHKDAAIWGPNVWVDAAGHAAAKAEDVRDVYAFLAEQWVAAGHTGHSVVVPANEVELVDAWFRLGFGHQHVHALRAVPSQDERSARPGDLIIRLAARDDIAALAALDLTLPEHQRLSPVFASHPQQTLAEAQADWEDDWGEGELHTIVAELDGVVVGSAVACPIERSGIHVGLARAPGAGLLGFAAVTAETRGRGIGRALGEEVLEWSRATGRSSVVTDWRMTNLLSSRTWPRLGFAPTFFRLHRTIA
jgi:GNAT superfamily N-acetyltransferase